MTSYDNRPWTAERIKNRIAEIASAFAFDYNQQSGGVEPYSASEFDLWFGQNLITVHSIDEVMDTPLFDGKSLAEIAGEIDIDVF